jgi:hypothetical protein
VRFTYEAFSSGWLKENFRGRGGPTDFLVMTAISNHARPLRGPDLRRLVRLGVATQADEGRLYARVTDVGLADELGCGRDTVKNAAERLAEKKLIRICELSDDFRDSSGQFSGTRAFLISGIPSTYVSKAITPGADSSIDRAGLSSTGGGAQADRAGLSARVTTPERTVQVCPARLRAQQTTVLDDPAQTKIRKKKKRRRSPLLCSTGSQPTGTIRPTGPANGSANRSVSC